MAGNDTPNAVSWVPVALFGAAAFAGIAWSLALRRQQADYTFRGKTALVTGGSRGLGLAIARELASEGARVIICARREDELERARLQIAREHGASITTYVCDVREPDDVNFMVSRITAAGQPIDILVNNAGVIQSQPFDLATAADFQESIATHFWGPYNLIRACLPHMKRQGHGRIVNISSIGGRVAIPHLLPYSVGKFALSAFSDGLNAELAESNIVVTTVSPGLMRTGSHRTVVVRGQHEREATWFGMSVATPLTSMNAERAARSIVQACREGRARITPGWQARLTELASVAAPEVTAAIAAALASWALPGPGTKPQAREARVSRELDLGWAGALVPRPAAAGLNQES
jgi:short-subunit dehydrogenase